MSFAAFLFLVGAAKGCIGNIAAFPAECSNLSYGYIIICVVIVKSFAVRAEVEPMVNIIDFFYGSSVSFGGHHLSASINPVVKHDTILIECISLAIDGSEFRAAAAVDATATNFVCFL